MMRIAYVNGRYVPHADAAVSVEDRGYQFADGVYEVATFYNGILVDGGLHIDRLLRSLSELGIPQPLSSRAALQHVISETIRRNGRANGYIYVQVTRGVASRDHVYKRGMRPSLVVTVSREKKVQAKEIQNGTEVITRPDIRWLRRDIKSIALLPNVLLKNEATVLGKREIWLTDENGYICEGAVSNAYIITKKGVLVTREEGVHLLSGIVRHRVLALAREAGIKVEERAFTAKEAESAAEAFLSSSTGHIVPVVRVNDKQLGDGKVGATFKQLFALYVDSIEVDTGYRIWTV
ncbi:MAG: D-amino-acid transaminase [Alphaproteobacteria bacterium]|nr:D-amino-acid transaminase [Alphaproteobacteria bacterium]